MASQSAKYERSKQMIKYFVEKNEPRCFFCGDKLDWKVFYRNLSGEKMDDWTEHHINHNHYDNRPENRIMAHRGCHRKHHRIDDMKVIREEQAKVLKDIQERYK